MPTDSPPWWRDGVVYQIYVRSFADGDGDGVGDLEGVRRHLPYLADLGVDGLWLTPFYTSPMADHGYDVADPRGVDPLFGDLATFDALVADAHALGLKVTVDLVPNHSSDRHPWFQAALAAGPGSPERERYLFRDGRGPDGGQPPNNWRSTFGGLAWTRVTEPDGRPGQWYLHLFTAEQPDLNWQHPEVLEDYDRTLHFWLDHGADGFRIDVAHGLVKDTELRDNPEGAAVDLFESTTAVSRTWDQPGVHDIYRRWRSLLDARDAADGTDRMFVGEVWVADAASFARYLRPDELHLAFTIRLLKTPWSGPALRAAVEQTWSAVLAVGAPATWVLSNHDVTRHLTRYGGGETGRRRARAAALLLLGLPGAAYLYQGEELGLPEVDLPHEVREDPVFHRSDGAVPGRDGCRVPLPWSGTAPPYGFTDGSATWLPMPADWAPLTVDAQRAEAGSMLALYRRALAVRREHRPGPLGPIEWLPSGPDVLAFRRSADLLCVVNTGSSPVELPAGEVLLASGEVGGGLLPADTAVWLRT